MLSGWGRTTQAIDLLAPLKTSLPLQEFHDAIRAVVPRLEKDRVLATDIAKAAELLSNPSLWNKIESSLGHAL